MTSLHRLTAAEGAEKACPPHCQLQDAISTSQAYHTSGRAITARCHTEALLKLSIQKIYRVQPGAIVAAGNRVTWLHMAAR
ncbi:hypothetical protein [Mucilaginibacter ginsenosidivorax]|uniref:Uncharacterized protein n=1 Tax=Mucilaginibacter ginsenosidivorax TaxID=862126 RepID=A0A5B8VT52_9SPHI|nr:hypothetical protein [Mucilaginibacter ginsenosidivorax]QEC74620.1 hypothetical protein FSB76_01155 [Mucilaginibacter ginsenosidivorax]